MIICDECGREYVYERKKGHTKRICNSCMTNRRRYQTKKNLVKYLGSKCSKCGYDKCIAALEFHHPNKNKDFNISGNHARNINKLRIEASKCILLCSNCHREEHYKPEVGGSYPSRPIAGRVLLSSRSDVQGRGYFERRKLDQPCSPLRLHGLHARQAGQGV